MSQKGEDGKVHPCAFMSKSMAPAEKNYDIYDKETLAVVMALQNWRRYLECTQVPVQIITDHKNLEYFVTAKSLSRQQLCWINKLQYYNYVIVYRVGSKSAKPDTMLRRPDHQPEGGDKETVQTFLKPEQFITLAANEFVPNHEILVQVKAKLQDDKMLKLILAYFANDPNAAPAGVKKKMADYTTMEDGVLYFRDTVCVPVDDKLKRQISIEV